MGRQPLMISYSNQKAAHSEKNMEKGGGTMSSTIKKGAWSPEEDRKLIAYINRYRIWNWNHMAKPAGLARTGKSCRLRWMNYLKPGVKHGNFTKEEEDTLIMWHRRLGNKWSTIASKLEGRTDNEIKNYYHTRIKKRIAKAVNIRDKPIMQDKKPSLPTLQLNKVVHSNIISQSLTQAVNSEATDNSTPNSESELGSLLDYKMEEEFIWGEDDRKSVNNGTDDDNTTSSPCTDSTDSVWPLDEVDEKLVADDVLVESSSSSVIASDMLMEDMLMQQLPSLEDMLLEVDFGVTSTVPDSFTLPYSLQESLANECHLIYDDLWGSSFS